MPASVVGMSQAPVDREQPVVAAVRAADAALDRACSSQVWQLSDDDVEAGLVAALAVEARATALQSALLAEAASRGLKGRTKALSTEGWLTDRFQLSRADAGARLRRSAAGLAHPLVTTALADAELTVEQAQVVTGVLDGLAARPEITQPDRAAAGELLVELAATLPPRELLRAGEALIERLTAAPDTDHPADEEAVAREQAAAEHAARLAERNSMRVTRKAGGGSRTRLELGPIGTATLAAWLSTHADALHPGNDGFEDERDRVERRGDALVGLLDAALGRGAEMESGVPSAQGRTSTPTGPSPDDAVPTEPADPTEAATVRTRTRRPPVQLGVTVSSTALQQALAGAGVLDHAGVLSGAELRRLACDAAVIPIVLDGASMVLDLGRSRREWTPPQRRAIIVRDRGCVAPGCDRQPADCQVHHQWEWSLGGPTDVDNGALLCLYHHQQVHRQGWKLTMAANGHPQLTPPVSIDPDRRPRQHHRYRLTVLTQRHRE